MYYSSAGVFQPLLTNVYNYVHICIVQLETHSVRSAQDLLPPLILFISARRLTEPDSLASNSFFAQIDLDIVLTLRTA